ncbi:ABC transporter substrate-binding protein [Lachnospiraceae bacterium OttesenSCG-928-D06]|nr:ABC transporter substrate-binding protein [Lachnospiraceae bacterium OttesenSCG-928-D06]
MNETVTSKKTIKQSRRLLFLLILTLILLTGCAQGEKAENNVPIRIASLKGPTSMGLLFMKEDTSIYSFQMATTVDEILPLMMKEELDIALLPANVAAILYDKMEGGITVTHINTLGVLYMVSEDDSIKQVEDLRGKTIYLTGKGTTPDYVLRYILSENGLEETEYTLEYKSEATEVAAILLEEEDAIGLLPQPFVTAACVQNPSLHIVMDLNEQWDLRKGSEGSSMVTGVTVVRTAFLEENEEAVRSFMEQHKNSSQAINTDVEKGAKRCVEEGIIANEVIAEKAIPECNITYIDGMEMKKALSNYLKVIGEQNIESIGGSIPKDDFYYIP